jgi:hypothetical protein
MRHFSGSSKMTRALAIAAFLSFMPLIARADSSPWAEMARNDVTAVHDTLRDNHPGPPDPSNPHYRDWLGRGFAPALARAARAVSYDDYLRVLEFYTNGFSDDHVEIFPSLTERLLTWSGFIVAGSSGSDIRVVDAEPDSGVKVRDRLLSCDGKPVDELLSIRTDPYFWNAAIPHARYQEAYRLFYQGRNDPLPKPSSCEFSSGSQALKWRNTNIDELQPKLDAARGLGTRELAMRQIGAVWLISIPTFNFQTSAQVEKAKTFLSELSTRAPELRKSTVVFDVRGNAGGDSSWADDAIAAFWGREWVDYVESQFDDTIDWRASPGNIAALEQNIARTTAQGHADTAAYYATARDAMKAALARGETYARIDDHLKPSARPSFNPVTGRVFVFTDVGCESSCLSFIDVLRRLPGVAQIGLATYADTNYIDNTAQLLPSGLGYISYSMKVYRHRARKNNEWYEPQIRWPGGEITDVSIADWVATLN